ncbi:MAG: hypothetical protein O3C40_16385 [Planctomycetota bacterium]|nr:hypothetical protein [Planctomycetota bacterium]
MPVSASQLKDLAPPGEITPIKVTIDPLGRARRIEPVLPREDTPAIDPRVMAIARDAIAARRDRHAVASEPTSRRQPGSWSWMHDLLQHDKLAHLAPQLSQAIRLLRETVDEN